MKATSTKRHAIEIVWGIFTVNFHMDYYLGLDGDFSFEQFQF